AAGRPAAQSSRDPGPGSGRGDQGPGMIRTLLRGGQVFDGTGAAPIPADVALEDGRIVDVGRGLDGDVSVDVTGQTVLPGLFDCHVHVTSSGVDVLERLNRPFSYEFFAAAAHLQAT